METIRVTSSAFAEGGWIPQCNSGYGENQSPALQIEGMAKNAVSLAITLDDEGHPLIPNYNHWVIWNLPPVEEIPMNLPKGAVIEHPLHAEQGIAYGKHCYRGPKPPFNWLHDYRFTVYVLDAKLAIDTDSRKDAVLRAMEGHILQTGTLTGRYRRKR